MVIGVDAGAICETDERLHVGLYRVTFELLRYLSKIDSENTYRLYGFAPIPRTVVSLFGNNMVNIPLTPAPGYMQVRLPLQLAVHRSDIFLGLSQAIPIGARNAIGFVYDLGFLQAPLEYGHAARHLKRQTEEVIARSRHIITISEATKKDLVKAYNIDHNRISVCLPGVSEVFLQPGEETHHMHPYILSVGLLKPGKCIPLAIRAFHRFLKMSNKVYDFIIIGGDTNLDPDIRKTIRELHLEKRVHLLGYVPDEEVAKWYRGAECLLALSTHEGFCLPAAEALVCGCPVIYAGHGALPEIVGDAGIGVTVDTEEAIAQAITTMCVSTGVRNDRRKKAFTQSKKYRWPCFANKVFQIINRVSAENRM